MDSLYIYILGYIAQSFFSARMLIQWILSERSKKVVSPVIYWHLSLIGAFLYFIYGWLRVDFSIILGQVFSFYIYIWNLHIFNHWKRIHKMLRIVLLLTPIVMICLMALSGKEAFESLWKDIPLLVLLLGSFGQTVFAFRFVYQWLYSRRFGQSILPNGFWIMSIVGSVSILIYALIRFDPVLILGHGAGFIIYARNVYLNWKSNNGRTKQTSRKSKKVSDVIALITSQPAWAFLCNFFVIMALFSLSRIFFFLVNKSYFPEVDMPHILYLLKGGLQFDLTALLYVNLIYLAMQLMPFRCRLKPLFQRVARWVFIITNSLALVVNCMDIPFFRFTFRRTTATIFSEFSNERFSNLFKIILSASIDYWYVTLFVAVSIAVLFFCYRKPRIIPVTRCRYFIYYPLHILLFVAFVYYTVIGIRGGFGRYTRPITISNATKYTSKGVETAIVLNTPFCLMKTQNVYVNPKYFDNPTEMEAIYTPVREAPPNPPPHVGDVNSFRPLNVVVIIWESLSKDYISFFNRSITNGSGGHSFTPFLDSLLVQSLTFKYSYSNGLKSIDAMPAVLSSIPMFIEPFVLTPQSTNDISSLADVLKQKGYYSAFFHGAPHGSMGFEAYANIAGFNDYFGYESYNNSNDFDGWWAIWDEEFLQYFAATMGKMKQPFFTSVFTASSHHPYHIPKKYQGRFPKGSHPVLECMAYTDYALMRYFEKVSQYEWFNNTLFVITADHPGVTITDEYANDLNRFAIPVLFYLPGSNLRGFVDSFPIQQIDIMPSVLSYLNYDKPFFAYGQDIFTTKDSDKFVINYNNGDFQLLKNGYFKQFNGEKIKTVFNILTDPTLNNNLYKSNDKQDEDEWLLKSIIQQYIERMLENRMQISE